MCVKLWTLSLKINQHSPNEPHALTQSPQTPRRVLVLQWMLKWEFGTPNEEIDSISHIQRVTLQPSRNFCGREGLLPTSLILTTPSEGGQPSKLTPSVMQRNSYLFHKRILNSVGICSRKRTPWSSIQMLNLHRLIKALTSCHKTVPLCAMEMKRVSVMASVCQEDSGGRMGQSPLCAGPIRYERLLKMIR